MTAEEPRPDWAFLGACVRRDRRARRWTQEELAERAGLALRTIGKYERGEGPTGDAVPSGCFAVGRALGWRRGTVEEYLFGPEPGTVGTGPADTDSTAADSTPTGMSEARGIGAEELVAAYRGVQDFMVLAVELGAPAPSVRRFSDAAGDLLEAATAGSGIGAAHGLAANSPAGGPPADDDAVRALAATADLPDVPRTPSGREVGGRSADARTEVSGDPEVTGEDAAAAVPHSRRRSPADPHARPSSATITSRRSDL
ncbi:helix-turn-helix domain-containing protein [Streptodolium elevatio]